MSSEIDAAAKPTRKVLQGAEAQARILEAVDELFYREGARAVSVDEVVKRAGVNKMSVYRQFESKDDLLLHYLARRDEKFWDYFNASLSKHPDKPREQLLQFFIDLAGRAAQPGYRGCPFVNIAVEFPDPAHPARRMVAENKTRLMRRLLELTTQAGAQDAQALANGLALLIEGAYAASQTYEPGHPLLAALPQVAEAMLRAADIPSA
ncbi:TetR/AcrR family transcriptional regulator [Crenobacter sp. SG2303]|uniref:TetR/AcrR family transcriptional regulator n=1 Tax=Crenobacter oryzisoli TaxID=3056844 RepID=A0ABT7XSF1_9NEIS|nr:TetR/AcrR family transcriptional regulator [Crenobacter sp. SG2303]MDN0076655.1 TetR/AcrR family transcriptional regulator [Crenobacter sp. SG2303]